MPSLSDRNVGVSINILVNKYISELEWYINQEDYIAVKLGNEVNKSLQYLRNIKYFLSRNIELMRLKEGVGLESAEQLSKLISEFEKANNNKIDRFMKRIEKASKKSRR